MHAWLIAALVVAWVLAGVLAGLLYLLVVQHGKVLIHLRELEAQFRAYLEAEAPAAPSAADQPPPGLPVGVEAPSFALPDLDGNQHRLEDYRGAEFVLTFFSPHCGYCKQMSPRLGKLKKGRKMVVITQGEVADNAALVEADSWRAEVVRDENWKVFGEYAVIGTPAGYLVDSDGRIASSLAVGADSVIGLMEAKPVEAPVAVPAGTNGHEPGLAEPAAAGMRVRDTSESRIVRDGLKAGTIAPNFVLPGLDGATHSLVDYHGKRVLLVFSAPNCGPCDALAPDLVRLHERKPDGLEIVMISRGDPEENRRKQEAHGFPFPVLLQRSWEISKEYGMFATPIAFLIGPDGIIERDVAVGPDAILALVNQA